MKIKILLPLVFILSGVCMQAYTQIDRSATPATTGLYQQLRCLSDDHILFGHHFTDYQGRGWHDRRGTKDRSDVKRSVGSYPALYGYDFGRGWPDVKFLPHVKKAFARGGVITISWHALNPVTGKKCYDTSGKPVSKILVTGSEHQAAFKGMLDRIARFAHHARVDGISVPIIFRPFHEHTGDWFWWGDPHCTASEFIALWRFTVRYLRNEKGVHNFLYAYSPARPSDYSYAERYPGDDYVDITGFDRYGREDFYPDFIEDCHIAVDFAAAHDKVAAITEFGYRKGINNSSSEHWYLSEFLYPLKNDPKARKVAYALSWRNSSEDSYWVPLPGDPGYQAFRSFYEDPFTLFLDNLPGMYPSPSARGTKAASGKSCND